MARIQRRIDGKGKPPAIPSQQTRKMVVGRANEKTDEELYRLCRIADYEEIVKILEFLQTRPPRNSAGLLSIPCGEADRPVRVEGGRILQRINPSSRIVPIKERHIFNKEGSAGLGIDVKVSSTSNLEILIWGNARTEEVQIVFIPTEHQSSETSEGSGELVAQNVKLIKRESLSMTIRQFKEEVGPSHAHKIFQKCRSQVYPTRQLG